MLAIAAYNAGEGRVDQWIFDARHRGEAFDHARHIPFPETRHYVQQVLEVRGALPRPSTGGSSGSEHGRARW